MEKLDSFQKRRYFFRKGGEGFRALEKPRSGKGVQAAETRAAPNVPKIFPTAETEEQLTEEQLIWEFQLCLLISSWMRWELKVSGLCWAPTRC